MSRRSLLAVTALLLASSAAAAVGVTGYLDDLASDMNARRAELAAIPDSKDARKAVKAIDKALRVLGKDATSRDYPREVKAASKVAKTLEKKLAGETALLATLDAAIVEYRSDLDAARDALADAAAEAGLTPKEERKLGKRLTKADRFLELATLATTRAKRLKKLAAAAKQVVDYIEEEGGNGGEPLTGETATWVISSIAVAPAGQGLDLDGDGQPDNALAGLGSLISGIDPELDLDEIIAGQLAGEVVVLIEMWGIDDWTDDALVRTGLMNGLDTDGDPSDNFSGTESFDVTGAVGADGHPLLHTDTALEGGVYEVTYSGEALELGGFTLPAGTPVKVQGTPTPASNSGLIGFAVPMDLLIDLIEAQGYTVDALTRFALSLLLDIDADGNGSNDSLSGALSFDSVPAGKQ